MPTVTFWNVQHLSGTAGNVRAAKIQSVVGKRSSDLNLLCEVQTNAIAWAPINANYRAKTTRQLCYAVLDRDLSPVAGAVGLDALTITDRYKSLAQKGGNYADRVMSRKAIYLTAGTFTIYAFHAPSSHKAIRSVAMVLDHILGLAATKAIDQWVMLGDMNCTPEDFKKVVDWTAAADYRVVSTGFRTHRSASSNNQDSSRDQELDWAITNIKDLKLTSPRSEAASDHSPIRAVWS